MSGVARPLTVAAVFAVALIGWSVGGYPGAFVGVIVGLALLVMPWWRRPLWRWTWLYLRRNRPLRVNTPVVVANDRTGGGIRYQGGTAIAAIQVLGRAHRATYFTNSAKVTTTDVLDVHRLVPMMRQSLGLGIGSITLISAGSRRRSTGDYARVYDTLIGPAPSAGSRETWLIVRIRSQDNGDALRWRPTVGSAALAAAQRIAAELRCGGIRAKVATATEIVELENRLSVNSLQRQHRRWNCLRSNSGWLATYAYPAGSIDAETLNQAWSMRADGIIQNVTVFPDGSIGAALTVSTPQPPTASPSVVLQTLPGEQVVAFSRNLLLPLPNLDGLDRGSLRGPLALPIGPSGVLLGRCGDGDRMLLPLCDPGEASRVVLAAEDSISKRIIIRAAAAGERITVHSTDTARWASVRMPHIVVTDHARPTVGTTVSVVDGTVLPAPRPNTVIEVVAPDSAAHRAADVEIRQTGPGLLEVRAAGECHQVEMEFFRAENRYVSTQSIGDLVPSAGMS